MGISIDDIREKVIIDYPCIWGYKIIGKDKDILEESIKRLMINYNYKYSFSHSSKNNNFHSFNIKCEVFSTEERLEILEILRQDEIIKMVI